jgi:hypothetical protein
MMESKMSQGNAVQFMEDYKDQVIGKRLSESEPDFTITEIQVRKNNFSEYYEVILTADHKNMDIVRVEETLLNYLEKNDMPIDLTKYQY